MSELDLQIPKASTSRDVLDAAVRIATGLKDVTPRPGQVALLDDIDTAMRTRGQVVGIAPTGTGKSMAYLVPAAVAFAERGQRTVISTESLALQSQIIDKDAPNVARACEKVTGVRPNVAVLKGWSNYVCRNRAFNQANALLEVMQAAPANRTTGEIITALMRLPKTDDTVRVEDSYYRLSEVVPLLVWALGQVDGNAGDRHSFPGHAGDQAWGAVSVSPTECLGQNTCPFADQCRPYAAREKAAEADIVVTNHSMLAVQAAKEAPVVIGNSRMGRFDHIVIDEAHTLPPAVRSQGSAEVSGRRVRSIMSSLRQVLDDTSAADRPLFDGGTVLAELLDQHLSEMTKDLSPGGVKRLGEEDNPVADFADPTIEWLRRINRELGPIIEGSNSDQSQKARRTRSLVHAMSAAVKSVAEHRPGVARWLEVTRPNAGARNPRPWAIVNSTPVDVGSLMKRNLWTAPDLEAIEDAKANAPTLDERKGENTAETVAEIDPTYELSVTTISATLPPGFGGQVGLRARAKKYESPFTEAFSRSALFVPRATSEEDLRTLCPTTYPDRPRLDTKAHVAWASEHIIELVRANNGSALVLAATATAGKAYAEALKAAGGDYTVLSQWDGGALRGTTQAWRENHHAVLVGTRSLMTGVDAPGDTCSLVIVDRVPRSPGNPVDDARVDAIRERLEIDKFAADRLVYATDAALLLEQASGRLIRSVSDTGMVAILDPRLLKTGPLAYGAQTREIYMDAVSVFATKISDPAAARDWLRTRRLGRPAA